MILLKGQLTSISTLADGTIKLVIGTQEVSPEMAGELFGIRKRLIHVGIAENDLKQHEIELLQNAKLSVDDIPNSKTPSQRLRSTLFVYWKQHDTGFNDFDSFYKDYIEKRIETIKSKLD